MKENLGLLVDALNTFSSGIMNLARVNFSKLNAFFIRHMLTTVITFLKHLRFPISCFDFNRRCVTEHSMHCDRYSRIRVHCALLM